MAKAAINKVGLDMYEQEYMYYHVWLHLHSSLSHCQRWIRDAAFAEDSKDRIV